MEIVNSLNSEKFIINGPCKAEGVIPVSGAKNAVLPIMAACLLTDDEIILHKVPDIVDVNYMIEILECAGKSIKREGDTLYIKTVTNTDVEIPYEPVKKMRASFNVYGPLTVKHGNAKVALPGGCAIGARPVNYHLEGLAKLGIESKIEHGIAIGKLNKCESEVTVTFPFPSVGATEQIVTSAALIPNVKTTIANCALEPEIEDLCNFLIKMGAKIKGVNSPIIEVEGVEKLHGIEYTVIPDRIEAGTFMIMGALAGKNLEVVGVEKNHLTSLFGLFEDIGIPFKYEHSTKTFSISAIDPSELNTFDVSIEPYPGFPTDLQAPLMILGSVIPGRSSIIEHVFQSRFAHVDEINRMGANISVEGNTVKIHGVDKLSGAEIEATDLRAAAALLLAALIGNGETVIDKIGFLFRGYENILEKMKNIGVEITYTEDN